MNYFIKREFSDIAPFLIDVSHHADSERKALGFLPAPAYTEAARQKKLILILTASGSEMHYAGHLLFGGIFPHLRVRQICVAPQFRRHGYATTLLRALKAHGETEGYLSIVANVATDLPSANSFYERNGFSTQRLKPGGRSRNRTINVKTLQLDTPSLFKQAAKPEMIVEFIRPRSRSADIPLYAIDLNVFFDAIKTRPRSEDAGAVFEAALSHQIRLVVSDEFVRELERSSHDRKHDPILALAKRIPTLPKQDKKDIENILPAVTSIVFPETSRELSDNDRSDVLHLCHTISAGAAGYITSDARVLSARDKLMSYASLDVIALSEFVELIELPIIAAGTGPKASRNFRISAESVSDIIDFIESEHVSTGTFLNATIDQCDRLCVSDSDGIIGTSILNPAARPDLSTLSIVCVRQAHPYSSTVADFLISEQLRLCSKRGGFTISLLDIPQHPITRRIALTHGYQAVKSAPDRLTKISLCSPVTSASWNSNRLTVERLGGLRLQKSCPQYDRNTVDATAPDGEKLRFQLFDLESLLSPTLFVLPKRDSVVVPITRTFADALLETATQLSFLEVPEAQFLSRRAYFNTTRAANVMIRGSIIAFYESVRGKGRGAIVAIARIVDVTTVAKNSIPEFMQRSAVVEDLSTITKADRALVTTFDNLMSLKKPVTISALRRFGCVPSANFVTATPISADHLEKIVLSGFADE